MNTVLDVLFLRTPRIEYVCPPICETIFSGSGSPVIVLEPISKLTSPTGLVLEGIGRTFLVWNVYPGQLCYTVYYQATPGSGSFMPISECVPPGNVALCNPGFYKISAITNQGESALSAPVHVSGVGYTLVPTPQFPDTQCFNVYRSDTVNGVYSLVLACASGNIFQTCAPGCFAVTAITLDGETPLSLAQCSGPCQRLPCPEGFGFNDILCECVPCDQLSLPCDPNFRWDATQCKCISSGGGGAIPLFGCEGDLFGETTFAPEGFVPPCIFSEVGPLPSGVVFAQDSPLSASVSGVPEATTGGVYNYVIEINDATDQFAEFSYQLTIFGFVNPPPPEFTVGQFYGFIMGGDGGTPPYTISMVSGALPNGLSFFPNTPASGFAEVGGVPADNVSQTATFEVVDSSSPPLKCFKTYTFRNSTCPDWSQVNWTLPSVGGSADFVGIGGHIHADSSSSGGAGSVGGAPTAGIGTLSYSGPGCNCQMRFNLLSYQNSFGGIKIKWNGSTLIDTTIFPGYNVGSYILPFTIPAGPGTITIEPAFHFGPGLDYWALSIGGVQPFNNINYDADITNL